MELSARVRKSELSRRRIGSCEEDWLRLLKCLREWMEEGIQCV